INATMSSVTGVPTTMPAVADLYSGIKQSLPAVENIESFLSSHQMSIAQLSLEYCNSLVDDPARAAAFFPGFNFGLAPAAAFDAAGRDLVIDPLIAKVDGTNLASQPADAAVKAELNALIDKLTGCVATSTCEADRTAITVKATCAAALGSGAMLIQ
ncbi:MAG: LamG domain-containing protein, partial [Gammaproteobacteria bacterium]